jgi:hypothetical protein
MRRQKYYAVENGRHLLAAHRQPSAVRQDDRSSAMRSGANGVRAKRGESDCGGGKHAARPCTAGCGCRRKKEAAQRAAEHSTSLLLLLLLLLLCFRVCNSAASNAAMVASIVTFAF